MAILYGVVAICNVQDGENAALQWLCILAILLITCMYITYGNIAGFIGWLHSRALVHGCIAKYDVPDGEDA